jgi:hypothetical protein
MKVKLTARERIALLLAKLPGQCNANLAMWAERHTPRTTPWSPQPRGCRMDADAYGACFCLKLRNPGGGTR